MTIPNLPTDNLYKFIALSGLALMIVFVLYPIKRWSEANIEMAKIRGDTVMIFRKAWLINNERTELSKMETKLNDELKTNRLLLEEVLKAKNSLKEKDYDFKISAAEVQAKLLLLDEQDRQKDIMLNISIAGGLVGIALAIIGFILWYVRVQKPIDQQLKSFKVSAAR
ncbi:MAG TPA: ATP-dependent Clp protease proteolytic subunit [Bacteroidia bacterium]|nr:ATP-dependent Clp protease proteolytic subunit [Bacteroidia bacterium]